MLLVKVAMLLDQHLEERKALGGDLSARGRVDHRAPGFGQVRAIVELAGAQERAEFAHRLADLVLGEMEEAERLKTRRVDDRGVAIEAVEARERRGVRARIARRREIADARDVAQHQGVHGARLSDTALPDQYREL